MPGSVPTVERPPKGLKSPWLDMWRGALKDMKESEVWSPVLRPLLDQMIDCYRLAAEHRATAEAAVQVIHHRARDGEEAWDEKLPPGFQRNMESGLTSQHKGFDSALRHLSEARALADLLVLTPKAKKALGAAAGADDGPKEGHAWTQGDELARRRAQSA